MNDLHYFYDCTSLFKNGGMPEVRVLHWFEDGNSNPKAVIAVIKADGITNPPEGEILKVSLGREFRCMTDERHTAYRNQRAVGDDPNPMREHMKRGVIMGAAAEAKALMNAEGISLEEAARRVTGFTPSPDTKGGK